VQNDWHAVEVLRVMRDTCMIRWDWDGSEDEIWSSYVRPAQSSTKESESTATTADEHKSPIARAAAAISTPVQIPRASAAVAAASAWNEQLPFAVGARVEGRYGDEWFDAVVVSCDHKGVVGIKWDYNGSESSVDVSEVRAKSSPPPQAHSPSRSPPIEDSRRTNLPASAQHVRPAAAQTPEPRTRDYSHPSPLDGSKQAWSREEPAKVAFKPENIIRILELIPEDAPAEVRTYLQSLIPTTAAC